MKIQVDEMIYDNLNIVVCFSTDFGSAKAFWDGEEPLVNHVYQVEVDINNTLEWYRDVLPVENSKESIQLKNDLIFISGLIDSIDEDGYTVLRLGNYIIPFLSVGIPFQVGIYVTLLVNSITLSPVN